MNPQTAPDTSGMEANTKTLLQSNTVRWAIVAGVPAVLHIANLFLKLDVASIQALEENLRALCPHVISIVGTIQAIRYRVKATSRIVPNQKKLSES